MIVLGADTHKRSHTVAAVAAATGELRGEQTVQVGRRGFGALLRWARSLDGDRGRALEDCRHVSGSLERFLIERGERVLRIRSRQYRLREKRAGGCLGLALGGLWAGRHCTSTARRGGFAPTARARCSKSWRRPDARVAHARPALLAPIRHTSGPSAVAQL
jgi:hypothetical protein